MKRPGNPIVLKQNECRLVVVQDQLQACPYLDRTTARMPLRLPIGPVTALVLDELLAAGFRRSGDFVYRTECPGCQECRPTRVDVDRFRASKSMRRVANRGDRELTCQWELPTADPQRLRLFNQHREQRQLSNRDEEVTLDSYRSFLVDSCCDTRELSVWYQDQLIAVSIVDVGASSVSAVYTHFDPNYQRYSLGTYGILKQIQWAREHGFHYVYLGMYVAENRHLNYKSRFLPQQRFIQGQWQDITTLGETG